MQTMSGTEPKVSRRQRKILTFLVCDEPLRVRSEYQGLQSDKITDKIIHSKLQINLAENPYSLGRECPGKPHIESNTHPTYNGAGTDQTLQWIGLNG